MIGYLNIYVKVVGKKDVYYVAFRGDFGKPILQEDIDATLESIKKIYMNYDEIIIAEFCTKEEYERETAGQVMISTSW
jgi:hypothetical protein